MIVSVVIDRFGSGWARMSLKQAMLGWALVILCHLTYVALGVAMGGPGPIGKITLFIIARLHLLIFVLIGIEGRIKALPIFRADEVEYHKYAAILAATEPIRLQCDLEIRRSLNPLAYWYHKFKGTPLSDPATLLRIDNKGVDLACNKYERKVDEVVKSYGLETNTFNELSRKLVKNNSLRQRVLLQAYYYKIAADLESNISGISASTSNMLPLFPSLSGTDSYSPRPNMSPFYTQDGPEMNFGTDYLKVRDTKFNRFCHAVRRIEHERLSQRNTLQNDLKIKALPPRMCDPDIYPAMCTTVQEACNRFPRTVQAVLSLYGLTTGEFEKLNMRTKNNFLFRIRVQNAIAALDKKYSK